MDSTFAEKKSKSNGFPKKKIFKIKKKSYTNIKKCEKKFCKMWAIGTHGAELVTAIFK